MRRLPMLVPPQSSFVVYRGPSALNGAPIVAILTGTDGSSKNAKTGPMAQLWIMLQNVGPHDAQRSGEDASVCGDCPLRPSLKPDTECYVLTYQGPRAAWQSNKDKPVDLAGALEAIRRSGVAVRLGAYGDPAALPLWIVARLAETADCTGYTHQWRTRPELRPYAMASCDTPADYARAVAEGWRTYRVIEDGAPLARREIVCPSSLGVTCARCRLCDGSRGSVDKRKSIAIVAH